MPRMMRLPSPPSDYAPDWANQFTRMLEAENNSLWNAVSGLQAQGVPDSLTFYSRGINFNAANTDNQILIMLPTGYSRFVVTSVRISGASHTLTTATAGVFTAAAGAGVAVVTAASAVTVSATANNTNNNTQAMTVNNPNTLAYDVTALYFRTATAEGAAATADVAVTVQLLL